MKVSFLVPKYPHRDSRSTIPEDEMLASFAYDLVRDRPDGPCRWGPLARALGENPPIPNKSARVYERDDLQTHQWITLDVGKRWYEELRRWYHRAVEALDRDIGVPEEYVRRYDNE